MQTTEVPGAAVAAPTRTLLSRTVSDPLPNRLNPSFPRAILPGHENMSMGGQEIELDRRGNPTQYQDMMDNIKSCFAIGFPPLLKLKKEGRRNGKMILVGGGPSVKKDLETIRTLAADRANCLLCHNDAHDWLLMNNIVPWGVVFMEVAYIPGYGQFLQNARKPINYLIASQSHPSVFQTLLKKDVKIVVWHARQEVENKMIEKYLFENDHDGINIGGGCNGMMRSFHIGSARGFRNYELFGADSSYDPETGQTHTYYDMRGQDDSYKETVITYKGRSFRTSLYLARQAQDFDELMNVYSKDLSITVHGDGLIPWMAMTRGLHVSQKRK